MNERCRELVMNEEFENFYNAQSAQVKAKFDYVMSIMIYQRVVNSKFVKTLENTEFYEMRVPVGSNEFRSVIFAVDALNFNECKQVILLNCFLKKSTSQYKGEIQKARTILNKLEDRQ